MVKGPLSRRSFVKLGATASCVALANSLSACSGIRGESTSSTSSASSAVSASGSEPARQAAASRGVAGADIPQTGFTVPVPAEYFQPCERRGTLVDFQYETPDRNGDGQPVTKLAWVYLPYGYDESDELYDVMYLMHGWEGNEGEFFNLANIREMFDHMIDRGDIKPVIFVTPTFYTPASDFGLEGSIGALSIFHEEFAQDLMPKVEAAFRTHAQDGSPEALAASRDHRAFGGFSFGGNVTWLEFCYDADYIRSFLPMSAALAFYGSDWLLDPEDACDIAEEVVAEHGLAEKGYFIFVATGTDDMMFERVDGQMEAMLQRSASFPPENLVYYLREGGEHDFESVAEYLYNALPAIFPLQ